MRGGAALAAALVAVTGCAHGAAVEVRPGGAGTRFRYRGAAEAVTLSGTMTGWKAVPLEPADGEFGLVLALPPGRYEYRLEVRDGGAVRTFFPPDAERVDDGFGGENAVLRVPP